MITDWRQKWYIGSDARTRLLFPFGFVQVCAADFCGATELPHFAGKSGNADKSGTSQTVREKAKKWWDLSCWEKVCILCFPSSH